MKRKPGFLIVLLTAGLTFGTLMATVGHRHMNRFGHCHTTATGTSVAPAEPAPQPGSAK